MTDDEKDEKAWEFISETLTNLPSDMRDENIIVLVGELITAYIPDYPKVVSLLKNINNYMLDKYQNEPCNCPACKENRRRLN